MLVLLVLMTIIVPIVMFFIHSAWKNGGVFFNIIAIASGFAFEIANAIAIYTNIKNNTVFTTKIHGIFINPWILVSGSYLGVYIMYRLLLFTWKQYRVE